MGYGTPPKEEISTLVIIIISLGTGIPTLLFLIGGITIFVRRRMNREPSRQLLED